MSFKRTVSILFSIIISFLILFIAVKYFDQIIKLLKRINIWWFLLGIACYFCNYLFRAYRLWFYGGKRGRFFPDYLKISGLHGFNSYFLPLRGGDLTLPLLLKLHAGVPLVQGGKILVRARVLDIYLLGFLLIGATLFTPTNLPEKWRAIFIMIGVGFIILPYVATYIVRESPARLKKPAQKIIGNELPAYPRAKESLLSFMIWFWTGCTVFCVIQSLDIPLSFLDVWFMATIQLPLQLLPVQGFANTGNHEAGWIIALSLLGVNPEQGLPFALSSHLLIICYVVFLGVLALLIPTKMDTVARVDPFKHSV